MLIVTPLVRLRHSCQFMWFNYNRWRVIAQIFIMWYINTWKKRDKWHRLVVPMLNVYFTHIHNMGISVVLTQSRTLAQRQGSHPEGYRFIVKIDPRKHLILTRVKRSECLLLLCGTYLRIGHCKSWSTRNNQFQCIIDTRGTIWYS